jgi:hypothetical protein
VLINPKNPMTPRFQRDIAELGHARRGRSERARSVRDSLRDSAHAGCRSDPRGGDPLTLVHSAKIAGLAARYRLPAMYLYRLRVGTADLCPMVRTQSTSGVALGTT